MLINNFRTTDHTFAILVYQKSPYLEQCIKSLLNQTLKSKLLIATSTPSSYLNKISKRFNIPVVINSNKKGIASDWSFAYDCCSTKYITLAHQDDVYFPEYTKLILYTNKNNNNNIITFTDYCEIYDDKYIYTNSLLFIKRLIIYPFFIFKSKISSFQLLKLMISFGNPICCPTIMYNKKNIGHFNFDSTFNMNLDWDAELRLAKMPGNFTYIKKILLARRIHKDSESNKSLEINRRQYEDKKIFSKLWPRPMAHLILKLYSISYKKL
jgi:glycosyltransferase involved in cell wall biosynthesis